MAEQLALPASHPRFTMGPVSESRLARLAASGDERAFAAIFERYGEEINRYCRAILRDPDEAQDALQNTMASALRSLPGETRTIALRPWLYRVAHNESLNVIRRRREAVASLDDRALPPAPAAEAQAESRRRLRELIADLDALPERLRSALVMRELSGLPHEEIAAALDISPGGARQAVYEARAALLELTEGREMRCDEVQRTISDRDGRLLRSRRMRAHLRSCERCESFRAAIDTRRTDLRALAPPLPALTAGGALATLGGGAGVGGISLGTKAAATIAVSALLGAGAASLGGLHTGQQEPRGTDARLEQARPASGAAAEPRGGTAAREAPATAAAQDRERSAQDRRGATAGVPGEGGGAQGAGGAPAKGSQAGQPGASPSGEAQPQPASPPQSQAAPPPGTAPGASGSAPAGGGRPATPPGSAIASEHSGGRNAIPTPGGGASAASSSSHGPPPGAGPPAGTGPPPWAGPPPGAGAPGGKPLQAGKRLTTGPGRRFSP